MQREIAEPLNITTKYEIGSTCATRSRNALSTYGNPRTRATVQAAAGSLKKGKNTVFHELNDKSINAKTRIFISARAYAHMQSQRGTSYLKASPSITPKGAKADAPPYRTSWIHAQGLCRTRMARQALKCVSSYGRSSPRTAEIWRSKTSLLRQVASRLVPMSLPGLSGTASAPNWRCGAAGCGRRKSESCARRSRTSCSFSSRVSSRRRRRLSLRVVVGLPQRRTDLPTVA